MGVFNENQKKLSDEQQGQLTSWIGRVWSTLVTPATTQPKADMEATMASLLRPENRGWVKGLTPFKRKWDKMKSGDFMQPEMVAAWQYLAADTLMLAIEAEQEDGRGVNDLSLRVDWERVWTEEESNQYLQSQRLFNLDNGQTTKFDKDLVTSAFVAKIDEIRRAVAEAKQANANVKKKGAKANPIGCLTIHSIPDASPQRMWRFFGSSRPAS